MIGQEKAFAREKEFCSVFKQLIHRHHAYDAWQDYIILFACAISNQVDKEHYDEREAMYQRIIKKYDQKEQELFSKLILQTTLALTENPKQDFLGSLFMQMQLNSKNNNQFFTPYHVCELMAKMTIGGADDMIQQINQKGFISISDSCCGTGATLIAGVNIAREVLEKVGINYRHHVMVAAQDIDMTVALMCYIQLSLLGVAALVKVGNSLTEPMTENDTSENYWCTPMCFAPAWQLRVGRKNN